LGKGLFCEGGGGDSNKIKETDPIGGLRKRKKSAIPGNQISKKKSRKMNAKKGRGAS